MPIIKVYNSKEKYKTLAENLTNINELSGRGHDVDFTKIRVQELIGNILHEKTEFAHVVDVDCGEGSVLNALLSHAKNLTGILPTEPEIKVVSKIFESEKNHNLSRGV